jgi:hypothetical protein
MTFWLCIEWHSYSPPLLVGRTNARQMAGGGDPLGFPFARPDQLCDGTSWHALGDKACVGSDEHFVADDGPERVHGDAAMGDGDAYGRS